MPGEEFEQNHSQRIDIGGRRDAVAADLLRRGVVGRHQAHHRHRCLHRTRMIAGSQNFGDAEVEQFRNTVRGHQDVRWLQIPVNDQIGMRILNRGTDLAKQLQPLGGREPLRIAELIERFALDEFHHEIRPPIPRRAAVQQPRDVRVIQSRQDLTLRAKPADDELRRDAPAEYLHCYLRLIL